MRGVTIMLMADRMEVIFQLTRLMRGVTGFSVLIVVAIVISTHTPHARRDSVAEPAEHEESISTHTPHARRDKKKVMVIL